MIFFEIKADDYLLSNKADLRKKVKYNATTPLSSVNIRDKVILKTF